MQSFFSVNFKFAVTLSEVLKVKHCHIEAIFKYQKFRTSEMEAY